MLAAVAGEPGVHVVGGAVRDALLGRVPRELDLVVEGDAVAVARRAAERVGGMLTVHERFGTATVRTGEFAFDLASARRERYPRPGALPEVELGATIARGPGAPRLQRQRDGGQPAATAPVPTGRARARTSTTASCACSTTARSSTTRRGCCGSSATRARLGFAPDPRTAALVDPALLKTVSGDRAGNELRLLLREPIEALRGLDGLGEGAAGRALRGHLAGRARRRRPARARRLLHGDPGPEARGAPRPPRLHPPGARGRRGRRDRLRAAPRHARRRRRRAVAALAPRAPRDRAAARRRRRARRAALARPTSATAGCRSRATTWSRRASPDPTSATGSRARWSRCSTAARPIARRSCGRPYPLERVPLGGRPDRRRAAARAGRVLDRARRRVVRPLRRR